ncbi:MAG: Uncharacterised protein [Marine Group II euryarchaeote MED-G33]|nr:MAG: Uncharacterised protein [Marine Group II euryarchaeote MED-G33]
MQGCNVGVVSSGLTGQTILNPLIPFIGSPRVGSTGKSWNIVATHKGHHGGIGNILILTSGRPVIQVLVIHTLCCENIVHHSMIEYKVSLPIQPIRTNVTVDGPVFIGIVFHRMTCPTHRCFTFQEIISPSGFKSLIDTNCQIGDGQIIDMLHSIQSTTIKIKGFHPPHDVLNELLTGIANFPIDIRHVWSEHTVKSMLSPITIGFTTQATFVEPIRMLCEVRMIFVNVVDDKVAHHANPCIMGGFNECMQLISSSQPCIDFAGRCGPITVVG